MLAEVLLLLLRLRVGRRRVQLLVLPHHGRGRLAVALRRLLDPAHAQVAVGAPPGPRRRGRRCGTWGHGPHRVAGQGGRARLLAGGDRGRSLHRDRLPERARVAGPARARRVQDRQRPRQGHRGRGRRAHLHRPPGRQGARVARRRGQPRRAPPGGLAPEAQGLPQERRQPHQLRRDAAQGAPARGVASALRRRVLPQPRRGRWAALLGLVGQDLQGVARVGLQVPRVRQRARRRHQHRGRRRVRRRRVHRIGRRHRQGVAAGDGREERRHEACPGEGARGGRERGHRHRRVGRGPRRARYGGVLKGHKMAVMCLAVAGNVVVSGSADQTLCVWRRDGAEHVCLSVLTGHTGPVKCVAMDEEAAVAGSGSDRRFVVYSGSLDGSVKVWRLSDAQTPAPVTERTAAPSQAWRGQPAPATYAEAWAPYQATAEAKRVPAA
uniref:Uncharacterized protein n=1 Tax=Aegilops tauschii subsp. strangulata TaxID=200361 RepID=A0A453HDB0_AEGTS